MSSSLLESRPISSQLEGPVFNTVYPGSLQISGSPPEVFDFEHVLSTGDLHFTNIVKGQ